QQAPEQYLEFDRYWKTVEKLLRQQLLLSKYMTLLQSCMLSNETSAKMAFDASSNESRIALASLAFSSINDNDVAIDEKALKAKYDEQKEMFRWNTETRDIKYAVCNVNPSETDMATLREGLEQAARELRADSMPLTDILGSHRTTVTYHEGMPYNAEGLRRISSALLNAVDTLGEKGVTGLISYTNYLSGKAFENMAVARLNRRYQGVDSIAYKFIGVPGQGFDDASQRADSLIAVIKGGESLDSIAVKMNQVATTQWVSANSYQAQETITPDFRALYDALHSATIGEPQQLQLSNQVLLFQVTEQRKPVTLYDVAIVSNEVRFSNDTYDNMFNKFSQFLSECKTAEDLEKNATKYDFQIMEQQNLRSNASNIGLQPLQNTREAVKWAFAQANEGSISEIYQNSADGRFVAVAVTKVHPVGYLDMQSVQDYLRSEVLNDKKAEMLIKKLEGAKTVADAQAKGAIVDTISHITFPTQVSVKGQRERGLSGAVAATAVGETVKNVVKGTNGVFLFNVVDRQAKEGAEFDALKQERQLMRNATQAVTPTQYTRYTTLFDVLTEKAGVKDYRYQF
ncbi:MAG: hypothetical protein ACSW8D_11770, partial [Prevotella sp.]